MVSVVDLVSKKIRKGKEKKGKMDRVVVAVVAGILYLQAETEAAQLRRWIWERRARMKMRERRRVLMAPLLGSVHFF